MGFFRKRRKEVVESAVPGDGEISAAVGPLVKLLKDRQPRCRNAAMEALGAIGDPRAVEPLIAAVRAEDEGIVGNFGKAFDALLAIGTHDAIEFVQAFSKDRQQPELPRRQASESLEEAGRGKRRGPAKPGATEAKSATPKADVDDLPELLAELQDPSKDWLARSQAASALGTLGQPTSDRLLPLLGAEDGFTRKLAARALGELGDARAVGPLRDALGSDDADVRTWSAEALAAIGEPAVAPLLRALSSPDWRTQLGAVYVFRDTRDARAKDELLRIVTDRHQHPYVVATACQALAAIGDRRAVNVIADRLKDKDATIREQAGRSLGQLAMTLRSLEKHAE